MPPETELSREAFELLREAYSETEAWKVAQLAATLIGSAKFDPSTSRSAVLRTSVFTARDLLAEARRQVAAGPMVTR